MYTLDFQELKLKETESLDSIVDQMTLFIKFENDRYYYTVNLPEPDPANYIPIMDITDEKLEDWFWENVSREQIDNIFVEREKQKASSAVKQEVDGKKKYKVKDHIKKWKQNRSYEAGDRLYYEWEEEVDTGETKEDGTPITEKVKHKKFFTATKQHTSDVGLSPIETANLFEDYKYTDDKDRVGFPKWKLPKETIDAYSKNYVVRHNGEYWQSETEGNTSEPPTNWKQYKHGAFPSWKHKITYGNGQVVGYNGSYYICLAEHTSVKENTPDTLPDLWANYDEVTGTASNAWSEGTAYTTGNVAVYNNVAYRVIKDHTSKAGETPDTATTLWEVNTYTEEPTTPTTYPKWKGKLDYVSGDVVEYKGTNYIALENHTSVKGEEPNVNDLQWNVYTEVKNKIKSK